MPALFSPSNYEYISNTSVLVIYTSVSIFHIFLVGDRKIDRDANPINRMPTFRAVVKACEFSLAMQEDRQVLY